MNKKQTITLYSSFKKSINFFAKVFPIIIATILLISILQTLIPKTFFPKIFTNNPFVDPFLGAFFGSILAGNPVTSYILGGEFLKHGISLIAVTAFIVSWVTVGIVQLPAEIMLLGKRFAITRNIVSFFLSILIAIILFLILKI